jgi:hypothetical protein
METTGNLVFGRLKARIHDQFLSPETQESARAFRYHISAVYEKRAVMRECLALCLMEIRRTAAIGGRVLELALRYVPEQHKTGELCLEVMKQLGRAFKFVPEKLKTPELCLCAVSS